MTKTRFQIDVSWPRATAPDATDAAHLSLRVGNHMLTLLAEVGAGRLRNYFRASAVTLAFWFADNWWRLRHESLPDERRPSVDWRLRHELTAAAGGTLWPPLMICGSGTGLIVAPVFGASVSQGPVRYLDLDVVHNLDPCDYEAGLDAFFEAVVDACALAQDGAVLKSLLAELNEERSDASVSRWRALEARLGFDPDEAPDGLIEGLSALEDSLGESAIEEAVTAAPGIGSAGLLKKAIKATRASHLAIDLSIAHAMKLQSLKPDDRTWRRGEEAAREVRDQIGLRAGPLPNTAFSELLDVPWRDIRSASATARDLPYGAHLQIEGSSVRAALQTQAVIDRRFELARMIGDAIWSPERFGVISRAKMERQKFQRAFAQSLLCPLQDVLDHVDMTAPSEEQINETAKLFNVRTSVVQTLLVNKGILPRETLEQRLEAA